MSKSIPKPLIASERSNTIPGEGHRVLKPGGVLTGSDSKTSLVFRMLHLFDVHNPIDVPSFAPRLHAAGFGNPSITSFDGRFLFRATKASGSR